ncbi:alanine racemase [Pelagerythrobacter rhizovicinus]|uniref:Alanine racemase n=1 Tax=Pelagerythrobacter rhizovicinus TaxID=2268576 RepID=A0A4Q2KLT7_9SPHN|nr:alanine racemase [Pelagerythrobacter rhizovicinus]RXZ65377.1 alanine racemase [Pelagerythrobacter rhizovicinus]
MQSHIAIDAFSSRLGIDLDAIRANYRTISRRVAPARCGAVVKANAYGLGATMVGPALYREGCRTFFVAQLCEAGPLEQVIGGDVEIFILNGIDPGTEALCAERGFVPVLNSATQVEHWRTLARSHGRSLPAALQVDSGMSRLGLPSAAAIALANDPAFARDVDLRLLMTHLACADEPARPANVEQLARFRMLHAHFPGVPGSIANSGGTFLGGEFHGDVARPGVALFGVDPGPLAEGLRPVVRLDARVLQIRTIEAGTGVGYGLEHVATTRQRLATIAIGYADGWPRCLGGVGAAWRGGARLPVAGRVSMDSTTVDISALPEEALREGDFVELIGPSQSLDQVARDAGTIAYEILTQLGARHARIYHESGAAQVRVPGSYP